MGVIREVFANNPKCTKLSSMDAPNTEGSQSHNDQHKHNSSKKGSYLTRLY